MIGGNFLVEKNLNPSQRTRKNTTKLVVFALLIALQIVLSRWLSINLQFLKIGFSFVPIMFAGYLYGASGGVIVAVVSDLIGAITINTQGAFFPGFTVSAALVGFIYGLSLKNVTTGKIIAGVIIKELLCSLLLNTCWLSIMYHSSFTALLATRIWQVLVMICVEIGFAEIIFRRLTFTKRLKSELLKTDRQRKRTAE